jgi:hypothetical protein
MTDFLDEAVTSVTAADEQREPGDNLRRATVFALIAIAQRLDDIATRPTQTPKKGPGNVW